MILVVCDIFLVVLCVVSGKVSNHVAVVDVDDVVSIVFFPVVSLAFGGSCCRCSL